jgi:hypothetical protein
VHPGASPTLTLPSVDALYSPRILSTSTLGVFKRHSLGVNADCR